MKNIRKYVLAVLLLTAAVLTGVQEASAVGNFKDVFVTKYNAALTRIDDCSLCHTAPPVLNPYGRALNERGINTSLAILPIDQIRQVVSQALTAIEPSDSDGDGFSNILEINSRTFPGNAVDPSTPGGAGIIDGTVRIAVSRLPVAGAAVTASGITVTTNNLGKFDISIAPGTYTVAVSAAGFANSTLANVTVMAGNRTDVDFDLGVPGQILGNGTIVGTVIMEGAPVPGAAVTADGVTVITDAAGNYTISIAAGTYNVTASSAVLSETEAVTVAAGVTIRRNLELRVDGTGSIGGTVRDAASRQVISGVTVTAGGITAITNALGKYEIHLAPGTYTVTAAATGFASAMITNVAVIAANKTDVDFDLAAPGQTLGNGTVVGTVVTNERIPIAGATVSINGVTVITDASGNYTINIAPGEYEVTASAAGFSQNTENVTVAAGVTIRRDFVLQSPGGTGEIDGTVRDAIRQPISGASVTASGITVTTNFLGKYEIHLVPGTYAVTATAAGFTPITLADVPVIADNKTDVDFDFGITGAGNGTIVGTVITNEGMQISDASVSVGDMTATTDAAGNFTISIVPGKHIVNASAAGFSPVSDDVTVFANQTAVRNLELIGPNNTGEIEGTVRVAVSRQPIAGTSVTASGITAITNALGKYEIHLVPGTYTVTATAAGFAPITIADAVVTLGNRTDVDFEFGPAGQTFGNGTIMGTVRTNEGEPIAGATVSAGGISSVTDALGRYRISIAPGTYTMAASAAGFASSTITNVVVTADNQTDVDFDLVLPGQILLTVDDSGGADYTRIQDAVDNASDGDTILVQSGTYYENVNVNKQLILRGVDNGGGRPVVDARMSGSAITLSAGNITLDGFEATNSSGQLKAGIKVNSNNNILKNNIASNNQFGIYLYSSSNNMLNGNNVSNNNYGIDLYSSSNNTLSGNTANSNNWDGIFLYSSSNNTLSGNTANLNRYSIFLSSSSNNMLNGNNVSNNNYGIYLYSETF